MRSQLRESKAIKLPKFNGINDITVVCISVSDQDCGYVNAFYAWLVC